MPSTIGERLKEAADRYRDLRAAADRTAAERDHLVCEASEAGLSRQVVADLTGLTAGRVHQILAAAEGMAAEAPNDPAADGTPQVIQALARANRVRLARAELKRSIGRGEVDVADVVRDCPWEAESMTLAELLMSQRRWGRTRARKHLLALAVSENTRIGALAPRQRDLLAAYFAARSEEGGATAMDAATAEALAAEKALP